MMSESVRIEKQDKVWTVILYRPGQRNAVDGPTAARLAAAFRSFEEDTQAKVAVLYGEGGTFCAGADLKAIATNSNMNRLDPEGDGPMGPSRMLLDKPVVAAVEGYAVAGGLELACWCDLRVASESAVFGVFCRRWGVPLIDGGTVRLSRLIGHSRALDMILTGRGVSADEALTFGLVNRVAPQGEARQVAENLAAEIAVHPSACMRNDRRSSYEQWGLPLEDALAREFALGMATLSTGEFRRGADKFATGAGRHGETSENPED